MPLAGEAHQPADDDLAGEHIARVVARGIS
jgi:hypothetical protein